MAGKKSLARAHVAAPSASDIKAKRQIAGIIGGQKGMARRSCAKAAAKSMPDPARNGQPFRYAGRPSHHVCPPKKGCARTQGTSGSITKAASSIRPLSLSLSLFPMRSLNDLKIQIYADGADRAGILDLYAKPYI